MSEMIAIEFAAGEGVTGRMLIPREAIKQKLVTGGERIDKMLERLDASFQRKAWFWFHPKQDKLDAAATIECAELILERVRLITGKAV